MLSVALTAEPYEPAAMRRGCLSQLLSSAVKKFQKGVTPTLEDKKVAPECRTTHAFRSDHRPDFL